MAGAAGLGDHSRDARRDRFRHGRKAGARGGVGPHRCRRACARAGGRFQHREPDSASQLAPRREPPAAARHSGLLGRRGGRRLPPALRRQSQDLRIPHRARGGLQPVRLALRTSLPLPAGGRPHGAAGQRFRGRARFQRVCSLRRPRRRGPFQGADDFLLRAHARPGPADLPGARQRLLETHGAQSGGDADRSRPRQYRRYRVSAGVRGHGPSQGPRSGRRGILSGCGEFRSQKTGVRIGKRECAARRLPTAFFVLLASAFCLPIPPPRAAVTITLMRKLALILLLASSVLAQKKPVTIETLSQMARGGRGASAPELWMPDGKSFLVRQGNRLSLYDCATQRSKAAISLDEIDAAAVAPPADEGPADWINRRAGLGSMQLSASGKELLYIARGDIFLVHLDTGKWDQITKTPVIERDARLAPDGKTIAFRRGSDLYAVDVATKSESRLTRDGSDTLRNGGLDWVYPEELELNAAFWWSPDSKSIAYLQFATDRKTVV